jgi:hypothetical protein
MLQWLGWRKAADLGPVRGGRDRERGQPAVYPDVPALIVGRAERVASLDVKVWGLDVEAHIPAGTVTADGGEQHLGPRRRFRLPSVGVVLCGGTEQPPQPTGVVVHPDCPDGWQGH